MVSEYCVFPANPDDKPSTYAVEMTSLNPCHMKISFLHSPPPPPPPRVIRALGRRRPRLRHNVKKLHVFPSLFTHLMGLEKEHAQWVRWPAYVDRSQRNWYCRWGVMQPTETASPRTEPPTPKILPFVRKRGMKGGVDTRGSFK